MGITIGGFPFHWYGLILALGMVAALWLSTRMAKKNDFPSELVSDGFIWVFVPGLVGARLYHVVDQWAFYSQHLSNSLYIWNGGVGIFGALLGGTLGLLAYVYWGKTPRKVWRHFSWLQVLTLLDLAAFGIPLAQAIGRWGNYVNKELYGLPTNLPWGVYIPLVNRLPGFEQFSYYQPLFLYESILSLGLCGLLLWLWHKRIITVGSGQVIAAYFIGYGVIRALLEPLRIDNWQWLGIPMAWLWSGGLIIVGLCLLRRRPRLTHD